MNITHFVNSVWASVVAAALALLMVLLSYFMLEPVISRAQATDVFLVQQTIVSEISFAASTSDVVMSPSINGLSGGYASGTTQTLVQTNNSTGYFMTIRFGTTTGQQLDKMRGATNGGTIADYVPSTLSTPDFNFSDPTSGNVSKFAFTVNASNTDDVYDNFRDNGTLCGQAAGSVTVGRCWMAPTSTNYRIIDTASSTPAGGATSTIQFKVAVPSSPSPAVPNDLYTATVTLTATTNI